MIERRLCEHLRTLFRALKEADRAAVGNEQIDGSSIGKTTATCRGSYNGLESELMIW